MKRYQKILFAIVLAFIAFEAEAKTQITTQPIYRVETPEIKKPLKTGSCINEDNFGNCKEYDYTYGFEGATCLADCVQLNNFGKCAVRNECSFHQPSGCFKRRVCTAINGFKKCDQWEEEAACN